VLELARRQKNSAGRNEMQILATMMTQSIDAKGKPVIEPPPEKLWERPSR